MCRNPDHIDCCHVLISLPRFLSNSCVRFLYTIFIKIGDQTNERTQRISPPFHYLLHIDLFRGSLCTWSKNEHFSQDPPKAVFSPFATDFIFCFPPRIVILPTCNVYAETATLMVAVPTDVKPVAIRHGIYTASPVHFDLATRPRKIFINTSIIKLQRNLREGW